MSEQLPPPWAVVAAALGENVRERRAAHFALWLAAGGGADDLRPAILAALADPHTDARRRALRFVPEIPGDRSAYRDAVVSALADPAWTVREAAVLAVKAFPDPDGAIHRALVALSLHDPKPSLRRTAAEVAGPRIEPERDYGDAIRHRFERQRMRAALAVAHTSPERVGEALPLLRAALADSHVKVRLAALQGAAILPRPGRRALLPLVARRSFEADDAVWFTAQGVWNSVLNEQAADDPLVPLGPFAGAANTARLRAEMGSLPTGHPLKSAWEGLSASAFDGDERRFAQLLARLCETVLSAEGTR